MLTFFIRSHTSWGGGGGGWERKVKSLGYKGESIQIQIGNSADPEISIIFYYWHNCAIIISMLRLLVGELLRFQEGGCGLSE